MLLKFLDPTGATYYDGKRFAYNLPRQGEKWARTRHPEPAEPDGRSCGPGRLHLMKKVSAEYAPNNWWPWHARGVGRCIGEGGEKAAYAEVELRVIEPKTWHRFLRRFGCGADLCEANLSRANLPEANLPRANLSRANLGGADLCEANLSEANLSRANLSRANLSRANLPEANLSGADLCEANLPRANLRWANLGGADLRLADLRLADLCGADLRLADLCGADLCGAIISKYTQGIDASAPGVVMVE